MDAAQTPIMKYTISTDIYRPLGYERVYLPHYKVADTPFFIQGDNYCNSHLKASDNMLFTLKNCQINPPVIIIFVLFFNYYHIKYQLANMSKVTLISTISKQLIMIKVLSNKSARHY